MARECVGLEYSLQLHNHVHDLSVHYCGPCHKAELSRIKERNEKLEAVAKAARFFNTKFIPEIDCEVEWIEPLRDALAALDGSGG